MINTKELKDTEKIERMTYNLKLTNSPNKLTTTKPKLPNLIKLSLAYKQMLKVQI
jgi:hypothetical protein